jgi:hypothetical protein
MPITYDEEWKPGSDKHSSVRQVYRDGKRLGRVRSWKAEDPGELTGEWFTVERWEKGLHVPQEGMYVDFQDALEHFPTKWKPVRRRKCGKINELDKLHDCNAIVKRSRAFSVQVEIASIGSE